ncbi:hypothetical protein IFO69_17010 [Echinicola sp. CAU 1574]|uniref:Uncharacterized protein n=1 Tax=Echinicola arenosa TaxID=2774144 RepID=A0ABR9ANU9_9BACT|nr:hypothetical protein [Echinicola arenosa]MBD8490454.1 hypothetical protein [Echinicola arenosa]
MLRISIDEKKQIPIAIGTRPVEHPVQWSGEVLQIEKILLSITVLLTQFDFVPVAVG